MLTQESVRENLREKCKGLKVKYIAEKTEIPKQVISDFKNQKRDLWEESLVKLNDYLNQCNI